jgi:hypothetical protein
MIMFLEIERNLMREIANEHFDEFYNGLTNTEKLEYNCNTGNSFKRYAYYEASCQARCTAYQKRPGTAFFENLFNVNTIGFNDYIQLQPDSTVAVYDSTGTNYQTTIIIDPQFLNELYPNGMPISNQVYRWWWPDGPYVNLPIPCGESCCKIERDYCWNPSLNNGEGGIQVVENRVTDVQYSDCSTRSPIQSAKCMEWIQDYNPGIDASQIYHNLTGCFEACDFE